ncbi:MAG: glyoxalase/bleomycin resistance/extradiol dioxygenase family protein [Zunongwangia sp.]|uniref:Glyoxalase n=2 Tax=Bacteroidota TaxID=976 RepID=A0ABQ1LC30_9BACT|nr:MULTISPECIES: VOC family protein [Flavobacteriaceae]MAG88556.1 glyoxalase/bleomycin resistance/extradiol dioxygenase family protein [Flavobacteriaceae bacterium]MAO36829.1 glyoxalase/bleomycin resistance/extradiol dioxygenase family protein [Zunongwangia sp.]GGC20551.1 glyoxalase [Marivirga lumbricoides]MAN25721.1 glyoxalase/bleomycin resistance/extradiol dioxygenase family protein [Mesonia sp.]MCC4230251.1 VOC family protein [Zunongwangia profunda]|tara:strand:+ start:2056 stop:2469 length:414 start_codon:yes stop_codon:yes gene_type:complete
MMLQKISDNNNVLTWFEIPVLDTTRAKKFYETIFDIVMTTKTFTETNEELTFFPYDPNVKQALSGRVTGVLSKSKDRTPTEKGIFIYINASPHIQVVIDKVEKAGGKVLIPKTEAPFGLFSVILDTEGNRIGLHAEE